MNLTENSLIYLLMVALSPFLGFFINLLFFKKNPIKGARVATLTVWIGFINSLLAWAIELPFSEKNQSWGFLANEISWLMATLILFVSAIVHHFSLRYMAGDRNFRRYFLFLGLVTISTLLLVASDHLVLLILFWSFSNLMLVLLMMHKIQWTAAKNSGIVAIKAFLIGFLFLILGTGLLAHAAGTLSLHVITENSDGLSAWSRVIALLFILMAAFSQSGGLAFSWLADEFSQLTHASFCFYACWTCEWRGSFARPFCANFSTRESCFNPFVHIGRHHSYFGRDLEASPKRYQAYAGLLDDDSNGIYDDAMQSGSIRCCFSSPLLAWFI